MFGIFQLPEERLKKRNEAILKRVKAEHARKKHEVRQNLLNKMNFLNPKMVLMKNSQSDVFFGYDSQSEEFSYGKFYDALLGDLFDLEQNLEDTDFEDHVRSFMSGMQLENVERDIEKLVAGLFYTSRAVQEGGYFISSEHPPIEIRIMKNDKVIARSGPFSPKHKGYFKEALYQNVVEDTAGTGGSKVVVSLGLWNGGETVVMKTFYVYEDQPRATVGPDIEHYVKVCSLFTPLLEKIEQDILSKNINYADYLHAGMNGMDDEVDDTLLGLPANPRSAGKIT
jgi:hypothetical protein